MKKTSLLLAALLASAAFAMAADLKLFYDKPAKDWETEALPIVNVGLGANSIPAGQPTRSPIRKAA